VVTLDAEHDPQSNLEAWTLIGRGIGYLGTGLSYFFIKKKRVAALLWPVAISIITLLWFKVGEPLLEKFVADTVKIERVEPLKPDSLRTSLAEAGDLPVYGALFWTESPDASNGNVERFPDSPPKGVPITIRGQVYGYADTNWRAWKQQDSSAVILEYRPTGEVFKVSSSTLDERIWEQRKK